jgi:galactokinase
VATERYAPTSNGDRVALVEPLAVTVPAAAGLIGAPADQLGGRVLGVALANYRAWAQLEPADGVVIRSDDDDPAWRSMRELSDEVDRYGHGGSRSLVTAALRTLHRHAMRVGASVSQEGFSLRYGSDIPRQVGFGGSTALVVAVQDVVCRHLGLRIDPLIRPSRPLLSVPSSSIMAASIASCSVASNPTSASAISPLTAATASSTPLPR